MLPFSRQSGFTLLEVLVAVVVLGVGMLGVAALQVNALKSNQSSLQRTQAVTMIYYMLDAMRANRADAANELYDMGKTCAVPTAGHEPGLQRPPLLASGPQGQYRRRKHHLR